MIRLTIVESPYAGDIEGNTKYAREACLDCVERNENPFASHLFYPQFLNDWLENEREFGIRAGYEWTVSVAAARKAMVNPISLTIAFYVDKGWSSGMERAFEYYTEAGLPCVIRRLETYQAVNGSSQIDTPDEERA